MNNPIVKIELKNNAINIYPEIAKAEYQFIYRSASGVYWNIENKYFYANEPEKWSIEKFFNQAIEVVYSECGFLMKLTDKTIIENIPQNSLESLIELYSYFQIKYDTKFEYVYVEGDGSIRELNLSERIYLRTNYSGGDGTRPYIKPNYKYLTPDKKISGYILRNKVKDSDIKIGGIYFMNNYLNELKSAHSMGYSLSYKDIEYLKLLNIA